MKDCIERIEEIAEAYPSRIAVIDKDLRVTYREFCDLVDSIAGHLTDRNPNCKVLIDLHQGWRAYAIIVATIKVNGTFCPLSRDAPVSRRKQVIAEFKPDLVILEDGDEDYTENKDAAFLSQLTGLSEKTLDPLIPDGEQVSYVIFTSGSTGVSKGVMIQRKSLNKFLEWSVPAYNTGENDIWGQFSSLSFDLSIVDIFTCLCSGATLFAMNNAVSRKYKPAKLIQNERITIWHSVPSAVEFMIVNEQTETHDFSSLKLLSFCGETLKPHQVAFLFGKKSDLRIFNTYGPTEGTLFCTWQEFSASNYESYSHFSMSIGKAIPGWNLYLKDTPEPGEKEIILYGDFIGKGYINQPDNTHFHSRQIGGQEVRAFETADIVTEKDGNLYFLSRKDRQIQVKGFRVELDEIEYRIREFLDRLCVTVAKEGVLYSFIEGTEPYDETGLQKHLKQTLEAYKIPNAIYLLETIPRNKNQKIDMNELISKLP